MDSHRMIVFSLQLIPNDSISLLFELILLIHSCHYVSNNVDLFGLSLPGFHILYN